jgi:hypothetical protein
MKAHTSVTSSERKKKLVPQEFTLFKILTRNLKKVFQLFKRGKRN